MKVSFLAAATMAAASVPAVARAQDIPPLPVDPPAQQAPRPPPTTESSRSTSMHMTYEEQNVERGTPPVKTIDESKFLHGFRIGYGHVLNYDTPLESLDGKSIKDAAKLRSPSHFLIGYEVLYRVVGHSWLNVLLVANGMIAGLEQSRVMPTGNFLIGAEFKNSFQIGVGANLSPLKGYEAHTIVAAGWTPRVGTIYTPVHMFFIPDVDGVHRMGITTGVTF
jgi:hypothetical protein